MTGEQDPVEDLGFDEASTLDEEDVVVLTSPDGTTMECIVLAIIDHEESSYALLTEKDQAGEEGIDELLVATYREDASGAVHFEPMDDDVVMEALREAIAHIIDVEPA
jgi:uncharacterized protein YrzB (UPF0473 family)